MSTDDTTRPAPLGVGILGGGFIAGVHARAARAAGARVRGVASSSLASAERAAERLDIPHAYRDLEELLADEAVDVVHVCSPNGLHADQAVAALESGRHVVVEKPMATTLADAQRIVDAARGRIATVPFVYRFHPLVREARARLASPGTGRIVTIQGSYLQDWLLAVDEPIWSFDAELGGASSRVFADIGSHLIDLVEFVTGDRAVRVSAVTSTVTTDGAGAPLPTEDAAAVCLQTASGAIGTLLVSQVAPGRKNRLHLEIAGAGASIAFDQEQPETLWVGRLAGTELVPRDGDQLSPDAARLCALPAGHPQGYQDAFNAFVADSYRAVAGDAPEGLPTVVDGLRAVRVTEAVMRAAASGGWVELAPEP